MGINSLNYISHNLVDREKPLMLLAYVKTDENTGLPGLFWDVPTRLFWGKFLRKPVRVTFGLDDFDKYPKGTGCIVIDKDLLSISFRNVWPDSHASLISDDTRLLRELCNYADIVLDPEFSASYRPRTKIKDFLGHTFDRGTLFVDSYAGTSLTKKALIILAVLLPLLFVTILFTSVWIWALLLAITCLVLPAIIGLIYRASPKAVISYLVLCLPFGVLFWAGLCRGIFVHRHHFRIYQRGDN